MEKYCEKCKTVFEAEKCPECGRDKWRVPRGDDACLLCEKQLMWADMLRHALLESGIPSYTQNKYGMGMAIEVGLAAERSKIYVPYSCLGQARDVCEGLFGEARIEDDSGDGAPSGT